MASACFPPQPLKAAVLDLDGTLLRDDKTFSDRTIRVVNSLAAKGIVPIIATGRCTQSALPYHRQLGLTTPLICCNGATVLDGITGHTLRHLVLDDEMSRELVSCSRDFSVPLHAFMDTTLYFEPHHAHADIFDPEAHRHGTSTDFDSLPSLRFTKVMFIGDVDRLELIKKRLSSRYPNRMHLVYTHNNYFEVMHADAGKQKGLEFVLDFLGISPEATLAVGDEENDLEMLTWVSHGVAMGNASETVRSAAPYSTGTNEQDGAAKYLELWFSLQETPTC